jgi:CubicO group peptidase (beta-lactamase class C family)
MHVTAFIRLRRQVRFALLIGFASSVAAAARAEPRVGVAESIARIEQDIRPMSADADLPAPARSLAERMAELRVPGLSVAVFDQGRILWSKGYGVRDVATGARVDEQTLFQAASISKPVAATAMLRLVERGDLRLDDDVIARLRSWKLLASPLTQVEKVTLRRIASHLSGLSGHGFPGYSTNTPLPTLPQILDGIPPANSPPVRVESVPGEREIYSGGGYLLMQLLMEEESGKPFADLVEELIFEPAAMSRSTFEQPLPARWGDNVASGHRADGTPVLGGFHVYPELAAAGLWTTPSDLAKFMISIGRSYRGEGGVLLQQKTAVMMLTRVPGGSGLGFGISGTDATQRYRHSGGNAGFSGYVVAFTEAGRGMVVLVNSDAGGVLYPELLDAVSREYGWPRMNVRAP